MSNRVCSVFVKLAVVSMLVVSTAGCHRTGLQRATTGGRTSLPGGLDGATGGMTSTPEGTTSSTGGTTSGGGTTAQASSTTASSGGAVGGEVDSAVPSGGFGGLTGGAASPTTGGSATGGQTGLASSATASSGGAVGGEADAAVPSGGFGGLTGDAASPATGGSATGGQTGLGGAGGNHTCGSLIDDMESGTGWICEGEGRKGAWYAFNDAAGIQYPGSIQDPAPKTPGDPILPSEIPGGREGSSRAMHTRGQLGGWGGGIGVDLSFDGRSYGLYDGSAYGGITFWARSDTSTMLTVRLSTAITTSTVYGGLCTLETAPTPSPCGPDSTVLYLTPTWKLYGVGFPSPTSFFDSFRGCQVAFEPTRLTNLQFMVDHPNQVPFDFWIDDLSFKPRDPTAAIPSPSCPSPPVGCEGAITFQDPSLEGVVRGTLSRAVGTLGWQDVCSLTSLCAPSSGIRSLQGIECLGSLETIMLPGNQVSDLTPLAQVPSLRALALDDNPISDLGPLRGLSNLESLHIYSGQISDLGPLGALTNLTDLGLDQNQIKDLGPLVGLTHLTDLELDHNQIKDLGPLVGLNRLISISLKGNQIADLAPLVQNSGIVARATVFVDGNPIDCATQTENVKALQALGVTLYGVVCR